MQIKKTLIATLLGTGLLLALPSQALASCDGGATYYVTDPSDNTDQTQCISGDQFSSCTLRAAILKANQTPVCDQIFIHETANPLLTLVDGSPNIDENAGATGDLDIFEDLLIKGLATDPRNEIQAQTDNRIFHIQGGAKVTLQNLQMTGGNLTTKEAVIDNAGGAILVDSISELKIFASRLYDNKAIIGGAIGSLGRVEIQSRNPDTGNSGSMVLEGNSALIDKLLLTTDLQANQINPGQGGAIANFGGYLAIGGAVIRNNEAGVGGAIYNSSAGLSFGNALITNSIIGDLDPDKGNRSFTHGGGIANLGPMTINNSAIINNKSDPFDSETELGTTNIQGDGGGIFNSGVANLEAINVTLSGNSARIGGGIFNSRNMTLTNVTVYNNQAFPCTFSCDDPERSRLGGHQVVVYDTDGDGSGVPDLSLVNTVIANEPSTVGPACAGSDAFESFVYSLGNNFDNDNSCGIGAINIPPNPGSDIQGAGNPGLETLMVNIEGTPTHALSLDMGDVDNTPSPLIDAGDDNDCPAVDQRFFLRANPNEGNNVCDIGAHENNPGIIQSGSFVDMRVDMSDSPDPIAPGNVQDVNGQLTFRVGVTNLYEGPPAQDTVLTLDFDTSLRVNWWQIEGLSDTLCSSDGLVDSSLKCHLGTVNGLQRIDITVNTTPTQEGLIESFAAVVSFEDDAFELNNKTSETTEVNGNLGSSIINWPSGGGGGAIHVLWLLVLLGCGRLIYTRIKTNRR